MRTTSGRPAVIGEAREQLTIWGEWTRQGGNDTGTGYRSPSLAIIRRMVGGVVGMPTMPDGIATKIDGYLGRLRLVDPEAFEAVRVYYVETGNTYGVSKAMRIDRRKAATLLASGEHWIAGRIDAESC